MPPGADIKWTSVERRTYQRNTVFGISNGALLMLADTFIHPTLVLALFVSQISHSNLLVGLVPALSVAVWFLPQLFVAAMIQGRTRRLPVAIWSTFVRALSIGVLGVLGFALGNRNPSFLLVAFFLLYTLYNLTAGAANVPIVDVVARTMPSNRLAFFFGQRNLWGGVLGFLAGFIIQRILAVDGAFPDNYALLFMASFFALALGTYTQSMMREPRDRPQERRATVMSQLRDSPALLANDHFRHFLSYRAFLSLAAVADPFYVVFAKQQLGAPDAIVGLYISAMTVARFASNLFWSPLGDRRGNRLVLQLSALIRMAVPVLALALPPLLRWSALPARSARQDQLLYYLFGLVFVAYGIALSGQNLANMTYLLDIAPEYERPAYVGLVNTILGVVSFVPVLGATLLDHFGFQFLFIVTFLISFAGVLASGTLHEPRVTGAAPIFSRYRLLTRSRRLRG